MADRVVFFVANYSQYHFYISDAASAAICALISISVAVSGQVIMASSASVRWRAFPCPITTPPDDRCLYHCISCFRDPVFYLSCERTEVGHFIGEQAAVLNTRAASIRQELVRLISALALMFCHHRIISAMRSFCDRSRSIALRQNLFICDSCV